MLAYGVLNAILYAGLLPLWDGFDEPFHYAYAARLWREGRLQNLGSAILTAEIEDAMELAPASYLVKRNIPQVIAFNEFFAMPSEQRADLRRRLDTIDPARAGIPGGGLNYEAQQAPLAYLLLAPFDALWRHAPIVWRILRLRLLCGIASALATGLLTARLAAQLGLTGRWPAAAMFLALSLQMFYAATAHVANDWLAVPLFTAIASVAIALAARSRTREAVVLSALFSAAMLTKAYFLALAPFVAGLLAWLYWKRKLPIRAVLFAAIPLLPAAVWYARNIVLYHDITGVQQTAGGIPLPDLLRAAIQMPWLKALDMTASTGIWLGNSSATRFSASTIHLMELLILIAFAMYIASAVRGGWPLRERVLIAAMLCFSASLLYSALVHMWSTHGQLLSPGPWYSLPIYPPFVCLLLLGAARAGRLGRVLTTFMLALWAYVIVVTYAGKLVPFYSGYPEDSIRIGHLIRWYQTSFSESCRTLSTVSLLPATAIWTLTALVTIAAIGLAVECARVK